MPEYRDPLTLKLTPFTRKLFHGMPQGIYNHQYRAIEAYLGGDNVCLTTGTASGKTLAFMSTAIETLTRSLKAKILAVYPLKALAREQEDRWRKTLADAGLPDMVARIDGSVSTGSREALLRENRVIIATPDVPHAWFLGSLSAPAVRAFTANLEMVVVDEVHVYTGVFGSNSAFLFRRLRHAVDICAKGRSLRFVAASATVADPHAHLNKLFGVPFAIIGDADDTSPRQERTVLMVRPPRKRDLFTEIPELLTGLVERTDLRFLAFVDSRRQTEQLASILARRGSDTDVAAAADGSAELAILPYRSGFEEDDRAMIQERLTDGSLRGVISTSALELGLDIPGMDVVVLIGVPQTGTSLQQRVGRVGRNRPGTIVIVDTGGVTDGAAFRNPSSLFSRPLAPTALYLGNPRIQYIHAMCIAGRGAEHDTLTGYAADGNQEAIESTVEWPDGFHQLCAAERSGGVPEELQPMKADAGDDPWHSFPLRDVGSQFSVEEGGERRRSVSHAQLMREAYPGAIYYYMTQPYRVTRVSQRDKVVTVRRDRYYITSPSGPPVLVLPQLQDCRRAQRFGELRMAECGLYISEILSGYTERRGSAKTTNQYPNDYWRRDRFTRNYSSTGVLLSHPALSADGVDIQGLAKLFLEAFLLVAPYERTDVATGSGKLAQAMLEFAKGDRYLALYDQTYGSLRLSGNVMEPAILRAALDEAVAAVESGRLEHLQVSPASRAALFALRDAASAAPVPLALVPGAIIAAEENSELIVAPDSSGWIISDENQEFEVSRVFVHPRDGLVYSGKKAGAREQPGVDIIFPVAKIQPIPGISKLARYHYDTGEVTPAE